jgi:tetratricopeptide (TPR) repeat protein
MRWQRVAHLSKDQRPVRSSPQYFAYVELANSYGGLVNRNVLNQKEFLPKAEAAARKALELDDSLAEAHLAMARVKSNAWDWAAAESGYQRAIDLNPNLVDAHRAYALYLRIHGRLDRSAAELKHVRELDPLSAEAATLVELRMFRKNDQALELAKKILEQDPSNPDSHLNLATLYITLGQYQEAIAATQEAINLGDHSPDAQISLSEAYAHAGERDKARTILKRLETGTEGVSPVDLAIIYIALGEREQAFALLETAYAAHDQQLIWLLGETGFDPLRSDPRFADLVRRVGLTP